jgi:arabinogalactan oligomer/maltooligosaccharide transport system permease protein
MQTKAQTKASEASVEAIDKRVDSELAESHNAQRQSFWKDQKSRRILGDVLTYVLLTVLGNHMAVADRMDLPRKPQQETTAPFTDTFFPTQYSFDSYVTLFTQRNVLDFPRMFMNTFIIAVFTCIISVSSCSPLPT